MSNAKGFTLVELLVVIALIGILSIIGFSTYSNIQKSARDTVRRADIDNIASAYEDGYNPVVGTYSILSDSQFTQGIPTLPSGITYTYVDGPDASTPNLLAFKVCTVLEAGGSYCRINLQGDPSLLASNPQTYTSPPYETPASYGTPAPPPPSFPSSGLVSYWKLDEASTPAADSSDSNPGIVVGNVTSVAGKIGNGKSFDSSSNSRIEIGDKTNLNLTTFTISAWVKRNGSCTPFHHCDIFSKGENGNTGYSLRIKSFDGGATYKAGLSIKDGLQSVSSTTLIGTNTWYHIVATIDGASVKLHVNGVLEQDVAQTQTPNPVGQIAKIGTGNNNNDLTMNGVIDEVGAWNRALSSTEVSTLYNGGTGLIYTPTPTPTPVPLPVAYNPKVLLLIYNPILESQGNQRLVGYMNWRNPDTLTTSFINSVKTASNNFVNYQVAERMEIDGIPVKSDGFQYTDTTYLACVASGGSNCHSPDLANYVAMINQSGACEKRNAGTIDELWIFGGPWFGYWESNLAGPSAFWYNSSPTSGTTCNKLLPIMGFSYALEHAYMLHDVGHRLESTMVRVYGSAASSPSNPWYQFSSRDAVSPGNGGCGNTHFPVNAVSDYQYGSNTTVQSACNDFQNYPNLTGAKQSINCSEWGCSQLGYLEWMFSNLPRGAGYDPQGISNNWWHYLIDPQGSIIDRGL